MIHYKYILLYLHTFGWLSFCVDEQVFMHFQTCGFVYTPLIFFMILKSVNSIICLSFLCSVFFVSDGYCGFCYQVKSADYLLAQHVNGE